MAFIGSSNEAAIKSLFSQIMSSGMPLPMDNPNMDIRRLQEQLMRSNRDIEELERRMRDEDRRTRDGDRQRDRSYMYRDDLDRGHHRSNFFGGELNRSDGRSEMPWYREGRWGSGDSFREVDNRRNEERKRSRDRPSRFESVDSDRRPSVDMASNFNPLFQFPSSFRMGQDLSMPTSSDMWSSMSDAARQNYLYGMETTSFRTPYHLEPPPASQTKSPVSDKPLGCHTVFIGGIRDQITEELVREIFYEICGAVDTVRISTGKGGTKFAHVRFVDAESVDIAVGYSGYKLFLDSGDERFGGRLHIDYAKSREDEKGYEVMLRAKEREARHTKNNMEKPLVIYSETAASDLMQNIRSASCFDESFQTLAQWLERGECTRKTSSTFYNLLSAVHNHIKRIVKEKKEHEEIVKRQKIEQEERAKLIMAQGAAITKIFKAASKKRCWDHFSKAQRRNIDDWHQQIDKEIKISEEEQMEKREEVGMDLDDEQEQSENKSEPTYSLIDNDESGEPVAKQAKTEESEEAAQVAQEVTQAAQEAQDIKYRAQNESLRALAEKNTSLIWEVEGYKKEIVDLKQKFASVFQDKDLQIARLMTAVHGLQSFLQNVTLNTLETNPTDIEVEVKHEVTEVTSTTQENTAGEQTSREQTSTEQISSLDQEEKTTENEKTTEKIDPKKAKNESKKGVRTRRSRGKKKEKVATQSEVSEQANVEETQVTDTATESKDSVTNDLTNRNEEKSDNVTENVSHTENERHDGVVRLTSQDMIVVGLLCSYLQVCPYGATTEQVLSHIQRHVPGVTLEGLATILEGLPMIFVGDGLDFYSKTWKFKQIL